MFGFCIRLEFLYQVSDYQVFKKDSDIWYEEERRQINIILVGKYGKISETKAKMGRLY
jgi:hypothetical protein